MSLNNRYYAGIFFLILWLAPPWLQAQEDTTFQLNPIKIESRSLRGQDIGCFSKKWSREELEKQSFASVGELLARESGVFIKSYGSGSLATSSIRGASAGHTAVIWNGLPVSSPMLGQLDLSLMPLGFADELQVQYGGNTSLWGSGAIGGTIILNNEFDLKPAFKIDAQHFRGSFGQVDYQTSLQLSNEKYGMRTRFFFQEAENDFSYFVAENRPLRTQTNNYNRREGILQEFFWKPDQSQKLSLHAWLQNTYREIPPTMTQTRSEAYQEDKFMRISLNYQKLFDKMILKARAGFFKEFLDYHDPQILLTSASRFITALGEFEAKRTFWNRHNIVTGMYISHTRAISGGYSDPRTQDNVAIFATDQFNLGKWQAQLSARQEIFDGELVSPVMSFGVEKPLGEWGRLSGKVSRNYRVPTLNDRYWEPGGNPDLKPESGWSEEAGIILYPFKKKIPVHYSVNLFNRNIKNWILWGIRPGESFWSANNLTSVWSRGIEQRFNSEARLGEFHIHLTGGYDYTLSTNQVSLKIPKIEAGSQLVYVPKHQIYGSLLTSWKNVEVSYQHRHTSSVHTLNFTELPAYQLGYARLGYKWDTKLITGDFSFQVENLWDVSYQVLERRAMPGRTFRFGVRIQFHPGK